MSFTPNIPASGQSLGNSRPQVLNNFASLRSTLASDHQDVNDSNPGYHKIAHFLTQAANPAAIPSIGQLFTKDVTINASTDTQLFFETGNGGVSQLTGNSALSSGYQFLGGVLLQWGTGTTLAAQTTTIAFPIPFTTTFVVVPTLSSNNNEYGVINITASNFQLVKSGTSAINYFYIAIGVK